MRTPQNIDILNSYKLIAEVCNSDNSNHRFDILGGKLKGVIEYIGPNNFEIRATRTIKFGDDIFAQNYVTFNISNESIEQIRLSIMTSDRQAQDTYVLSEDGSRVVHLDANGEEVANELEFPVSSLLSEVEKIIRDIVNSLHN